MRPDEKDLVLETRYQSLFRFLSILPTSLAILMRWAGFIPFRSENLDFSKLSVGLWIYIEFYHPFTHFHAFLSDFQPIVSQSLEN